MIQMKERRKFLRFPVALKGEYTSGRNNREACVLSNISREGAGMRLHVTEKIDGLSDIQLHIGIPTRRTPVQASAKLLWIKEVQEDSGLDFIAGIHFKGINEEDKWSLLDYAYDDWYSRETKSQL